MNILGLHFGHDAAASVVRDGVVINCVLRERLARHKHALGLDAVTVGAVLEDSGLAPSDIDFCALTSTQSIELISLSPEALRVTPEAHPGHAAPSLALAVLERRGIGLEEALAQNFLKGLYGPAPQGYDAYRHLRQRMRAYFPEHTTRGPESFQVCGCFDDLVGPPEWREGMTLEELANHDLRPTLEQDAYRQGMHLPVTVELHGHRLPGYLINHHLAHAASAFYPSGLKEAVILSHNGWMGLDATNRGLSWLGQGGSLRPLAPHFLSIGSLYELTGFLLGLGPVGQEGKLMGLAPYGRPTLLDRRWIGNFPDVRARGISAREYFYGWFEQCCARAEAEGYDLSVLGDPSQMTEPINADIAASTQALFEESMLQTVEALRRMLENNHLPTRALCLVGGAALNCPANSRISREAGFDSVIVPPWTDDSGLALGAALALYHTILGQPRTAAGADTAAYLGKATPDGTLDRALAASRDLEISPLADAALDAAREIAAGSVVGWYEGRSELGPRALGHRSILADPRQPDNWERVNEIKGRESWRPLAPAVLAERAEECFAGCPLPSPAMLFTARVLVDRLPAVTHVDGSARVQTVAADVGGFHRLLEAFESATGCPVLLNTSLNGPGEPIVESPEDALSFLRSSTLDALYIGAWRVSLSDRAQRATGGPSPRQPAA